MKVLALLALCAIAYATRQHQHSRIPNRDWLNEVIPENEYSIEEEGFRAQREYRYIYNGQLATGIPQSSKQHAATRIQAVLSLVFKTDKQVLLKLTHVRMGKLNRRVPNPRELLPFEMYEEAQIGQELREKIHLPVMFKYNNGLISEIVFDGEEQPWSANIKRGVLNMLQVNLKQHQRTDLSEEQLLLNGPKAPETPEYDFFTSNERTLEGECETYYTITKQPSFRYNTRRNVLNVTKSINFEKCQRRPDIRYNQRFAEYCPSCDRKYSQHEKNLQSSTVARYNISGDLDNFLIEKAVVESQYIFAPINEQMNVIATYVNQSLTLFKAGPIRTEIVTPSNPIESDSQMIYTPDWDIMKEEFFMEGDKDFLKKSPYSEIKNKVEFVEQILLRLVRVMADEHQGIQQEAPRQLARLVKALRMCTLRELNDIHQQFYEQVQKIEGEHQKKVKDVLVDALALAATKNTIQHLITKTKERSIHPVKAALAIKGLVNSRVVSEKQIEQLLQLCNSQVAERSPFLKQSCYLTVGSMINALCKNNPDKLAVEFKVQPQRMCPRSLKVKYVKILIDLFNNGNTKYEKVLALKTLANSGLDMAVFDLEKIIKNMDSQAPHSVIIRSQAIDSLRQLRSQMPRKIQKILMPIFKNKLEFPQLRMAAVAQIMQTQPERPILDQIAQQLFQERSHQVQSFVYTLLQTYANSTNPCEKRVAQNLQLSLRHARQVPMYRVMTSSKYIHMPFYNNNKNVGATFNFASIMTNDSYLPKEVMASLDAAVGGQWFKYFAQIGFIQQNGENLFEELLGYQGLLVKNNLESLLTRGKRSVQEPRSILRSIFKKLNIVPRRQSQQEPSAMLYMRFKDQDYAVLPLDSESMPEQMKNLLQSGRINVQEIERFLAQGYHMDFHMAAFVHEISRKIPTSIGFPLLVSSKMPTIMSLKGHVKAVVSPQDKIRHVKLMLNVQPKMALTMVTKVEAWTPIVNTGLKIVESMQLNLPIKTEMQLDAQKTPVELKMVVKMPTQQKRIFSIQSRPITYTRVWPKFVQTYAEPEEKTIYGEEWDKVNTFNKEVGKDILGVEMRVHGQWHRMPFYPITGTPCGPFAGPNQLHLTVQPASDAPKELLIKINGEMFSDLEDNFKLKPEHMSNFYEQDEEKQFFRSEYESERSNKMFNNFNKYYKSYTPQNPNQHTFNVLIETRGSSVERKAQLSLKSQCGERMRFCKWQMEILRSPIPSGRFQEQEPWMLVAKGEYLYPRVPYNLQQLKQMIEQEEHNQFSTLIEAKWGPKSRKDQFLLFKIQGEHSQEQKQLQRSSHYQQMYEREQNNVLFTPISQYDQLLKAAALTKFKVQVDYKMNPFLRNVTNKVYRAIKYYQYQNMDVDQMNVQNQQGKIQAIVKVCPKTFRYVNITARLPQENIRVIDARIPLRLRPINIRRSSSPINSFSRFVQSVSNNYNSQAKCVVSSRQVKTFDQVKYRVPLTTCYSVLAKDCAGYEQPKFAVLMRKINQQNDAKKLKIVTPERVIELEAKNVQYQPEEDMLVKIVVDGRQISLDQDETWQNVREFNIYREGQYVKVELRSVGVSVYFDGYMATIKTSPLYRNAQCGLCGHYDGEVSDELRLPNNRRIDSSFEDSSSQEQQEDNEFFGMQKFHRSFFHQDEECEINDEIVNDQQYYRHQPLRWEQESNELESSNELWNSNEVFDSQEMISKRDRTDSSSQTSSEEREDEPYRRQTIRPRQATKVIEYTSEICFSRKPVPKCPRNSYPIEYEQEKKVPFGCVPRTDPQSHVLQQLVRRQQIVDSEQLKPSFVESVLIPKKCKLF